jgi:hypothetical protein
VSIARLESEPGATERDVGRRPAEILREARHVFEPRADLLCIQIDGKPADADDVERYGPLAKRLFACCSVP